MFRQQTSPSGRALHIVRWRGRNQYETNNTLVQYILGTYVSFGVSVAEVERQFLHFLGPTVCDLKQLTANLFKNNCSCYFMKKIGGQRFFCVIWN